MPDEIHLLEQLILLIVDYREAILDGRPIEELKKFQLQIKHLEELIDAIGKSTS